MSSHRADRHRAREVAPTAAQANGSSTQPGRRKASSAPRRRATASASSLIGGAALVVAALGAAHAGQAVSTDADRDDLAAVRHEGAYVARLSTAAVQGRHVEQISRSAARPSLGKNNNLLTAAQDQ
ncbi:MAG: hypothetical protein H0V49_04420, partial [Nocardioidaceae bacterium]|nr:hypothetical protein [Nocardioidaceae bacterium]